MDISIFDAIILGALQGFTEFIPVSSSAHMALYHAFRGTSLTPSLELAYDAILQLATLGAVFVFFWKDIVSIFSKAFHNEYSYFLRIVVTTLPAVILGFVFEQHIETIFRGVYVMAGALVVGSLIMIASEKFVLKKSATITLQNTRNDDTFNHENNIRTLSLKNVFYIGLFQALALIPGMSRSGMTISGGMIMGLTRYDALKYSFIVSIPIIAGSGLAKFIDVMNMPSVPYVPLGISFIIAFVCGLGSIVFLIKFVAQKNFWPFIWYRLVLACIICFVAFFA